VPKPAADANGMRLFLRERFAPLLVLVGLGAVLPATLLAVWGDKMVMLGTQWHFTGVGVTALAAALAALALTIVGIRRKDGRVILIGTAFTVMAALLAIHGLATPGVIVGYNGVLALTGALTLPAGAAILALSALPPLRRPHSITPLLWLEGASLFAVITLGVIGLGFPSVVPDVPDPKSPGAVVACIVGISLFAILILRALKTYLLTRRSADCAVVIGVAWLMAAIPPATLMTWMELGWWIGHALELAGIVIVSVTVAVDLHRSAQSRSLVGDFSAAELVAAEEAFLGVRVHALLQRLAEKDESTEEHTRRVALRAVQVGEQLGLPPGRLRALAIGGLLHDMGKLSVPDRILKKPSSLEDDEFAVIKKHPEWGVKLLRELGGFPPAVLELVHNHHERLDGKGYPRRLEECELSLDTRIMTVCDVYDALVSPRVYRDAWNHESAMALLHEQTGTAFDERCVAALDAVLGREQPKPALATLRVAAATA
jgi:putative nucleotidyltransferase with HDIG domain